LPPGIEGVVVDVKIFTRKDEEKQKDVAPSRSWTRRSPDHEERRGEIRIIRTRRSRRSKGS